MPAYVIVDVHISDPIEYEEYKKLTPATIAAYGGKFIVRGGQTTSLEGVWQPGRIVILEFPTVVRAEEWWNSDLFGSKKDQAKSCYNKDDCSGRSVEAFNYLFSKRI